MSILRFNTWTSETRIYEDQVPNPWWRMVLWLIPRARMVLWLLPGAVIVLWLLPWARKVLWPLLGAGMVLRLSPGALMVLWPQLGARMVLWPLPGARMVLWLLPGERLVLWPLPWPPIVLWPYLEQEWCNYPHLVHEWCYGPYLEHLVPFQRGAFCSIRTFWIQVYVRSLRYSGLLTSLLANPTHVTEWFRYISAILVFNFERQKNQFLHNPLLSFSSAYHCQSLLHICRIWWCL